jgi:alpha-L-fucosidase
LGQSGELTEYTPDTDATTYFEQKDDGIHISCMRAQRIYNNHKWHNPVVLKITNAEPALTPPIVETGDAEVVSQGNYSKLIFHSELIRLGDAGKVKAGFQYREYAGFAEELNAEGWEETRTIEINKTGEFELNPGIKKMGKTYQYRAFTDHPKLRVYGDVKQVVF